MFSTLCAVPPRRRAPVSLVFSSSSSFILTRYSLFFSAALISGGYFISPPLVFLLFFSLSASRVNQCTPGSPKRQLFQLQLVLLLVTCAFETGNIEQLKPQQCWAMSVTLLVLASSGTCGIKQQEREEEEEKLHLPTSSADSQFQWAQENKVKERKRAQEEEKGRGETQWEVHTVSIRKQNCLPLLTKCTY